MQIEVKMPALSPTMEKGTLARWLVREGDQVKPGDLIAEIETDKATMELEADEAGTVATLLVTEGTEDVPVGTVIALLGDAVAAAAAASQDAPVALQVAETADAVAGPIEPAPAPGPAPAPAIAAIPLVVPAADGISATPLARRVAAAKGLSLANLKGTGPKGRIVIADLGLSPLAVPHLQAAGAASAPSAPSYAPPAGVPVESVKLSGMRKTIARRLTESKQTVPHFYLTVRCRLDPLLKLRGELNASLGERGVKLSVNDMLMKAMALAMAEVPDVNVQFGGDELHRFRRVDISMAVAVPGGLVTPVLKDVEALSLSAIATESKALAAKARDGRLEPDDYQGGTASISNLGMHGVDEMVPVINPPQALILGVAAGVEQPWKVDGAIGLATIMAATASFDHRAIDGATGAQFMKAYRELVEQPLGIVA